MSLSGKVCIVTGGASGIGLGIVNRFLGDGAKVAVIDINNLDQFKGNDSVLTLKTDISSDEEVNAAIDQLLEKWGKLDVVVNNAGVMDNMSPIGEVPDNVWQKCFAVNVNGTMHMTRRAVKVFLGQESKGSIVNVASTAGFRGGAAGVAYTASKHAVIGISRSTAYMYAREGITCNTVLPGSVPNTNISSTMGSEYSLDRVMPYFQCIPGTLTPDDIAATVYFLATTKSVNGAEVAADKGWTTV